MEKEINHGAHGKVKFTSAEMQGWRKNMEDAKIALPKVEVDTKIYSIFGVFDGHGGKPTDTQERRSPSSWRRISSRSSSKTTALKKVM